MSELRVDNIVDMGGSGAPKLRKGANVTGISTITQAVVGNATINAGGINATGIVTSSSNKFVGDLASGNITAGVMTATSSVVASNITINSGGVNASGIVSATSYQGSGANLTGIGLSIAPLAYNPDVSESDAALTGIGLTFNQRVFAGVGTVTLSLVSIGSTVAEVIGIGTAVTKTYTVTVSDPGSGNKYYLDGNLSYNPVLYPGGIYTFDQSAGTNATHPLRFATAADAAGSTQYTTGVETNGTPGNSGAYTRITVAADAPTLYYYCTNHSGMGSFVTIGANVQFNNDANPPNITITPKTDLTVGQQYAISYPSGVFVKNDGSNYVGTAYTFSARGYDFQLWGWGYNPYGMVDGSSNTNRSSPIQIPGSWSSTSGGGGGYHAHPTAAFIKTDGTLWTWGSNSYGQLGQNDSAPTIISSPKQLGSDTTWATVYMASATAIATKTDGTLWVWGNNQYGNLGQNYVAERSSPVQIPGTTWSTDEDSISAGNYKFSAKKTDGTLWTWGLNNLGHLGLNDTVQRSSPVQIPGTTWNKLGFGWYSSCAIKTDGTLWSWGYGSLGNLAQNNRTGYSSPVQIPGTTWSSVSIVANAIATKTDGTLWTWGTNAQGILGLNQPHSTKISSPTQVPGTTWSKITQIKYDGLASNYAIKTDGTLWSWGYNQSGNLGQNNNVRYSSPVQIPGTDWHDLPQAGYGWAYAIKRI